MQSGNHLNVKLIDAGLGQSPEKETPFIKLVFKNQENENITHYLWLTQKTKEKSIDDLTKLGFLGNKISDIANDKLDFDDIFGEPMDRVDLVIESESYRTKDGEEKTRQKVKWLNIGSGGMAEFNHEQAQKVFDGEIFDGLLREKKRILGEVKKKEPKKEVIDKSEYTAEQKGVDVDPKDLPF